LPNCEFQQLYIATRDGFAAKDFHQFCDNKGPTLTIIQSSEGYLFGGYSADSWDVSGQYKYNIESFIFTLINPHDIAPTIYHHDPSNKESIHCEPSTGPSFGYWDIRVEINSNIDKYSTTFFFSKVYKDTTGKGPITFTGEQEFTTSEIEVWVVILQAGNK